jgi:hypothetical protein
VLGGNHHRDWPVDTIMAAALPSHVTFFSDLRRIPGDVLDRAAPWLSFYQRHREHFGGVVYPLLADPLEGRWTALQSWDPDAGRGALLAFRQDSDDPTARIGLRNVPPGRSFSLSRAPDGASAGTVTSAELAGGIEVSVPEKRGAEVLLIEEASP